MQLLSVPELAALLHKAESSIYSDLIRNPQSLPPRQPIKGSRRVLFRDVENWLQAQASSVPTSDIVKPVNLGRGRPTKHQQLLRKGLLK